MLARTYLEAKNNGEKIYKTGKPCKNGHIDVRYVSGRRCRACMYEFINKEKKRDWHMKNREYLSKWMRERRHLYEVNKEARNRAGRNWAKRNPERRAAYSAAYRARIRRPPENEKLLIEALYAWAKELSTITGRRYTVDHIFPLKSDWVCGLHVFANLRVIEASENSAKGNRRGPIHELHSITKGEQND